MKKVLFLIFASLLVLGACSQEKPKKKNENKQVEHKKSNDPKKNKRSDDKKKNENKEKLQANENNNQQNEQVTQNSQQTNTNNQQTVSEQTNTQNVNNQKQNVKIPKNSEVPEEYIKGDVANALDRKSQIEQQAIKDNENGLISDKESQRRQEQAGDQFNQAIENQYGPQD